MFNHMRAFLLKGFQRESLEKSQQNYLKQAMQKTYPPTGFKPTAIELPLQVRIFVGGCFSRCLFLIVAVLVALP